MHSPRSASPGFAARARLFAAALWTGSLWAVGYQAAMHFATLDRATAGAAAARLFAFESWLTLGCAAVLTGLVYGSKALSLEPDRGLRRKLLLLIVASIACTVVVQTGLQPMMAELRAQAGPGMVMEGALRAKFGLLHGLATLFYVLEAVLTGLLLWKMK